MDPVAVVAKHGALCGDDLDSAADVVDDTGCKSLSILGDDNPWATSTSEGLEGGKNIFV